MLPSFVIILLVTALLTKAINFSNGKAGEQAMDNSLWIVAILVIFLCIRKKRRTAAAVWHIQNRRKKNKEILVMKELVKQFIGKECIIHTIDSRFNRITRSCVDTVAGYFNMLLIFRNLCASAFSAVTDLAHSASFPIESS